MLTHMAVSLTQIVASGIRAEMARQGMTQQQLSAKVGITQQTLSRRLKHEDPSPCDTDELERIAKALEIPAAHFLAAAPVSAGGVA